LRCRPTATWRKAGPELECIRADDIRRTDTVVFIRAFEGLLPAVLASHRRCLVRFGGTAAAVREVSP